MSLSGCERKNFRLYTLCENARNDKDNIMLIYKKACLYSYKHAHILGYNLWRVQMYLHFFCSFVILYNNDIELNK